MVFSSNLGIQTESARDAVFADHDVDIDVAGGERSGPHTEGVQRGRGHPHTNEANVLAFENRLADQNDGRRGDGGE
jgi:hypothetical protein